MAHEGTNSYTFARNTKYSGSPKPSISKLTFAQYPSATSVYQGLQNGALSEGQVPTADLQPASKNFLPPVNPLSSAPGGGYNLQAVLSFQIFYASINYNNPTYGPVFRQRYFRQALTLLTDQADMNAKVGRGYSASTVAGVPSEPPSQWISPAMREHHGQGPYPYDVAEARALLASHGWTVVGGALTCEHAGTGASDCGAGIPTGRQATFAMLYPSEDTTLQDEVNILKGDFAQAGISLTPTGETVSALFADVTACTPSQARCKWTFFTLGGWYFNSPGAEPTGEQLFQTGAAYNSGSYSDAQMNALITATHVSDSLSTFDTYADYTAEQVPSLWMPSPVTVMAVSRHLRHVSQSPLGTFLPEYWKCTSKKC